MKPWGLFLRTAGFPLRVGELAARTPARLASAVHRNARETTSFPDPHAGAVVDAYTTGLPGRCVLSDFACDEKKEPPCEPDPKTGECPPEK